jgi:hypothetical protein
VRLKILLVILLAACPASAQYSFIVLGDPDQDTAGVGAGPGEQAGYVTIGGGLYPDDALIWKGAAGTEVNLDPGGVYLESRAHGTNGSTQVGWARQGAGGGGQRHACTWAGSAATFNDLNPVGYYNSEAFAIDGEYQIGYASSVTDIYFHAMRWRGSHDLFIDLHPIDKPEYDNSQALDGAGGIQAGYADGSLGTHAAMWAGDYTTFLDLHPAGTANSVAYATDGTKQGGRAQVGSAFHAFLWESSAASGVDVNPAGESSSEILDMIPGTQVGSAGGHAYLWKGTAGSALDLHSYVTGGYTASSASGIAADGTIVGTVGFGGPVSYAAMWVPVPEPSLGLLSLAAGTALVLLRRRRSAA